MRIILGIFIVISYGVAFYFGGLCRYDQIVIMQSIIIPTEGNKSFGELVDEAPYTAVGTQSVYKLPWQDKQTVVDKGLFISGDKGRGIIYLNFEKFTIRCDSELKLTDNISLHNMSWGFWRD